MDRLATAAAGSGDADASRQPPSGSTTFNPARPTAASAAREASTTIPSKSTVHSSATSSAASSPFASREPSPSRTLRASIAAARNFSSGPGNRSRKNSQQDLSPSRPAAKTAANSSVPPPLTLHQPGAIAVSSTPTLSPSVDPNIKAPLPQKSASTTLLDSQRDAPRWLISPRLRSPPPVLNKPSPGLPRKGSDQDLPSINFQRPTPPVAFDSGLSDNETDDSHLQPGMRTPARGSTSTLETVQEVSPLGSPTPEGIDAALEKLAGERLVSDTASQPDVAEISITKAMKARAIMAQNESGSEAGSIKAERRPAMTSAPSGLGLRQPSSSTLAKTGPSGANKTPKPSEGTVKTMTVETETVASIPQVSVAPAGMQGSNGSLRTKPSSETIRPRKEKRKPSRKQQMVQSGAGETLDPQSASTAYGSRVPPLHHQSIRSSSARAEVACTSPIRSMSGQGPPVDDAMTSPRRWSSAPTTRSRTLGLPLSQMNNLLTRSSPNTASSKADNFEAKIASAVDEADTSDSDETFVYDSNPPDARDRPHNRFHSRTPSATSMASQVDRSGMRSIHGVMDVGYGHPPPPAPGSAVAAKKKKFSNTYNPGLAAENLGLLIDEDGGSGRGSASGSGRGATVARHPHHIGLWGRPGNGHTYLFDNDSSPFLGPQRPRIPTAGGSARNSPVPPSPRFGGSVSSARGTGGGKRGPHLTPAVGYDLDDTTTEADNERTPLVHTMRSPRTRRGGNRYNHSLIADHQQRAAVAAYRQHQRRHQPSLLNRMASCLVLTVMLLLVVSGAIGFMFATSQPLTGMELVNISNVIASEQELMFDMKVKAQNPNVVLVVVDSSDLEIFAKSPYAGSDSWRPNPGPRGTVPRGSRSFVARRSGRTINSNDENEHQVSSAAARAGPPDGPADDPPPDDMGPLWRLGTVRELDQPLQFEGSFFNKGASTTTGSLRLEKPGNSTEPGGTKRWARVIEDEFDLVVKGVLKYSLPLSRRVRTIAISGKTRVKPNSASDPGAVAPGTPESLAISAKT